MPSEQQDIKSAGYGNSSSAIPDRRSVNPTAIVLIPQQPNYLPQPFQYVVPNSYNMPVPVGPCDQYNPLPATAQPTNGLPVPPPIIGYPGKVSSCIVPNKTYLEFCAAKLIFSR